MLTQLSVKGRLRGVSRYYATPCGYKIFGCFKIGSEKGEAEKVLEKTTG